MTQQRPPQAYQAPQIHSFAKRLEPKLLPIQPSSPGGRPEYCMSQLRSFAMTDTAETFRQGVTAYRNARDWTKEQRDEAIKQANERVVDIQSGTLVADASFSRVFSFTAGASFDELDTIEALSQESEASQNKDPNTAALEASGSTTLES